MKSQKCQSCFSRQKFTLWLTFLQVKQVDLSRLTSLALALATSSLQITFSLWKGRLVASLGKVQRKGGGVRIPWKPDYENPGTPWNHEGLWEKNGVSIRLESEPFHACFCLLVLWVGGVVVSMLVSGASVPGSSPGRGHCVVFLGKTLYSRSGSLSIQVYKRVPGNEFNAGGNPAMVVHSRFLWQKPEIRAGLMGHLARLIGLRVTTCK